MAQTTIPLPHGRADPYPAAHPPAFAGQSRLASARAPYVSDNGGISGGLLRPGAVDQELFKAHLAAAQKDAATAAPPPSKAQSFAGIPTLTPAQLAALGVVEEPAGGELVIDIPAPNPPPSGAANASGTTHGSQADRFPFLTRRAQGGAEGGIEGGIQGGAGIPGGTQAGPQAAPLFPTASAAPRNDPVAARAVPPDAAPGATPSTANPGGAVEGMPETTAASPSAPPAPQAHAERGLIPGSRRGADGVWELRRLPDKEEREMLRGQKWRIVESEQSRKLFFGPDGEFGWDDFVDMINPLQHIPLVNIAYRAITGDQIYGAARLVDVAFGPGAGISTVVDLAMRDVTGGGIADNAIAALFGGPGDAPAGDVAAIDTVSDDAARINTASGARTQLADAELFRRGSNK